MAAVTPLGPLYTSAPILDEDDERIDPRPLDDDDVQQGPGVATLAPEQFDAAILAALIAP